MLLTLFSTLSITIGANFLPKSFIAKYEKQEKSSLTGKIKTQRGTISYMYPSRFKIKGDSKLSIVVVINPFNTWHYQPPAFKGAKGELVMGGKGDKSISEFFDILKNGLKTNTHYQVKKLKVADNFELNFSKPTQKKLSVKSAGLVFSGKTNFSNLTKLRITDSNDKEIVFKFDSIKTKTKLTVDDFVFDYDPKTMRLTRE